MDGGVVIEGARDCIVSSRLGGENEEAWRRVSQDPSWMHSCDHMWHLIAVKLTELKESCDQNAGIAAVHGVAPAGRVALDRYALNGATGIGVGVVAGKTYSEVPPVVPHVTLSAIHPASRNIVQSMQRIEDRGADDFRRTGRDQFKTGVQPRRSEELTDVAGARILKAKEAYMTRPPAPLQAKDRLPEPRINGAILPRDDAKKGREAEVLRRASAARRWKGVMEEKKVLGEELGERGGSAEDRRTMVDDSRQSRKVIATGDDANGVAEERQGSGEEKPAVKDDTEEPIAQTKVVVGEKRKRDADTERKEGSDKLIRDHISEGPKATKDALRNEKLQVVLFRTEGGRAVHVDEKNEVQLDHAPATTTDSAPAEEADEQGSKSSGEGVGTASLTKEKSEDMNETNSESLVVMCDRKDMPTSSAGDPLPIKRKRRMDEVMEEGKPAKRPGTSQTLNAVKQSREVHHQPSVTAPVTKAKSVVAVVENSPVGKARVPSFQAAAPKAKVASAESAIHVRAKSHVIQIPSIDGHQINRKKADPEEPELEFKCGCTSKELGDTVGLLKVYKSGELVIFCECKPGCAEAGKPLSPSGFERHAGRGAAKKWKNTIWLVVENERVPLYKVKAMEPYVEKNKGRKNLIRT